MLVVSTLAAAALELALAVVAVFKHLRAMKLCQLTPLFSLRLEPQLKTLLAQAAFMIAQLLLRLLTGAGVKLEASPRLPSHRWQCSAAAML